MRMFGTKSLGGMGWHFQCNLPFLAIHWNTSKSVEHEVLLLPMVGLILFGFTYEGHACILIGAAVVASRDFSKNIPFGIRQCLPVFCNVSCQGLEQDLTMYLSVFTFLRWVTTPLILQHLINEHVLVA
jgi:hypothetical protein